MDTENFSGLIGEKSQLGWLNSESLAYVIWIIVGLRNDIDSGLKLTVSHWFGTWTS